MHSQDDQSCDKNEKMLSFKKAIHNHLSNCSLKNNQDELSYWVHSLGEEYADEAKKLFNFTLESDPAALHRILIARDWDIDLSTELFFEQIIWRARWQPKNISSDQIPNSLPSGAWRLCGYAKDGVIISNYKLKFWDADTYAVDEYVRYVGFMIELMISKIPPPPAIQKFMVIFDLQGFYPSIVFKSNVRMMIRKLIYVSQAQYPERLHKVLLVNAPYGFSAAWKLISPLLDKKTVSKIQFATVPQIANDVDLSVLPIEYYGTHDEYPLPSIK